MEIFQAMNYNIETTKIDDEFIDLMIDRCFTIDQYVIVKDTGRCWAKLQYRKYTYQNNEGSFTSKKSVRQLKKIFHHLINKYNSFEHEGYKYFYSRGNWAKYKP